MNKIKSTAVKAIDACQEELNSLSLAIWNKPELALNEKSAHTLLTECLDKHGFEVSRSTPLETSFIARFRQTTGTVPGDELAPRIGIMCEYDALPNIGHACGHNLIAEAGIAASLGIKAALQADESLRGEVVVFGTPAEESGGGKVRMIKAGSFLQVDACMMVHPYAHDIPDPIVLAEMDGKIVFHGKAAHAAAAPWDGVNALDAAVQFYTSVAMLRQQTKPTNRIQTIIKDGGEKPNIIPRRSELACVIRGITMVDIEWGVESMYKSLVTNPVLLDLYMSNGKALGMNFDMDISKNWASTDAGNVSHEVPTIQPCFKIEAQGNLHTKEFADAACLIGSQQPTLNCGKAMACAAIDMFMNPSLLTQAKKAFN